MPSDLEKLILDSLDFNDQVKLSLEDLVFTPAAKKPKWVENPNTDGAILLEEPQHDNSYFELLVRVVPAANTDAALKVVGEIIDKLQECESQVGGSPMTWTPNNSSRTYTAYVLMAEIAEMPITVTGDLAGWFIESPVLRIKLTCASFLYGEQKVVKASTESAAEPLQVLYVQVGGDVPAEALAIITDKAAQNRRHLRLGQDVVAAEAGNPSSLILAASLSVTGLSGAAKTRSGAYSEEKVIRATAIGLPTAMLSTGAIKNIGFFRVFARVFAGSLDVRYRIAYRNGDGPWSFGKWVEPSNTEWCSIDLGEATFDEALTGEQRGEIRIETYSEGSAVETDVNYLEIYPVDLGFKRTRGIAGSTPTKLVAYDTFLQTEGALTAKAMPLGGNWAGAGDADDFTVIAAEDLARRVAVADANLQTGRYALAGTTEPTTSRAIVSFNAIEKSNFTAETFRRGVFLRYTSVSNWLLACIASRSGGVWLVVIKCVAGTPTILAETKILSSYTNLFGESILINVEYSISLVASAEGSFQAWVAASSTPDIPTAGFLTGQDAALATSGALQKGRGGFYDAYTSAEAKSRYYRNFYLMEGDPAGVVCYSGRNCRIDHEKFTRQESAGKYEGQASLHRGGGLELAPEGDDALYNRLVLSMRRNDVDVETDLNVTDKHSVEVLARERFLAPR